MSKRSKLREWAGGLAVALLVVTGLQARAACTFSVTPAGRTHGYGHTNNIFGVTASPGCSWSVVNTSSWVTILSPLNNTNSNTISYSVAANPNLSSRTSVVVIATETFTIRQNGINCDYSISPENRPHGHGATNNTINVSVGGVCNWTATSANNWLIITGGASGMGDGVISYSIEANPSFLDRTGTVAVIDQVFTVTQRGAPCMFGITPATRMHGYGTVSNTVSLTATEGCAWTATPFNNWITIVPSGVGSSNLAYRVDANPYTIARTGTVLIADQLLTLIQDPSPGGACIYDVSPKGRMHGYGSASNYTRVSVPAGCFWTVENTNSWLSILPYPGVANGDVGYLVSPNPSMMWRTGTVTVAGQTYTVRQEGAPCTASIVPKNRMHGYGGSSNYVRVPLPYECSWTVQNTNSWISIVPGYSGIGTADVGYMVDSNLTLVARVGVVTIANQNFTVTQSGFTNTCSYSIQPATRMHGYGANSNYISVTAGSSCAWTVQNTNPWISVVSGASGIGNGTVGYLVAANTAASDRSGTVMVADQVLTVGQRGTTNTIEFQAIITLGQGRIKVSLFGEPGAIWELQSSADLQLWEKVSNITNTTGTVEYTDNVPAVSNRRFYRAILP